MAGRQGVEVIAEGMTIGLQLVEVENGLRVGCQRLAQAPIKSSSEKNLLRTWRTTHCWLGLL